MIIDFKTGKLEFQVGGKGPMDPIVEQYVPPMPMNESRRVGVAVSDQRKSR